MGIFFKKESKLYIVLYILKLKLISRESLDTDVAVIV